MNEYGAKISDWASVMENGYEKYIPYKFPRETLDYDNKMLYPIAYMFWLTAENNRKNGKKSDEDLWLEPLTYGNMTLIIDKDKNTVRDVVYRTQHGVPFLGYRADMDMIGGRGSWHQIAADMADYHLQTGFN